MYTGDIINKILNNADGHIKEDLNQAINNIFLKYQILFDIKDGGIDPLYHAKLEDKIDDLTNYIINGIKYQAFNQED